MKKTLVLAAVLLMGSAIGCSKEEAPPEAAKPAGNAPPQTAAKPRVEGATVDRAMLGIFGPLPETMLRSGATPAPAQVDLGRMLYYDTRLSKNQDISCNSCHQLDKYGVDGNPTSPGHKGQLGGRNSPTTYNAAGHFVQFWDGRAADVEAQAQGPVTNPVEMAIPSAEHATMVLKSIPGYAPLFKAAFPDQKDPINLENAATAIGAFERGLVTPSRFDSFLKGDDEALTEVEKQGLATFLATGCQTCHLGPYMGGAMYQKLGLVRPWQHDQDKGRFDLTGIEADKMVFKVPSLRNITETGPYFHDGRVEDLKEAIKFMGSFQLGKDLSDEDAALIYAFFGSLKGELPSAYIKMPELPASGPKTPKPDPS